MPPFHISSVIVYYATTDAHIHVPLVGARFGSKVTVKQRVCVHVRRPDLRRTLSRFSHFGRNFGTKHHIRSISTIWNHYCCISLQIRTE